MPTISITFFKCKTVFIIVWVSRFPRSPVGESKGFVPRPYPASLQTEVGASQVVNLSCNGNDEPWAYVFVFGLGSRWTCFQLMWGGKPIFVKDYWNVIRTNMDSNQQPLFFEEPDEFMPLCSNLSWWSSQLCTDVTPVTEQGAFRRWSHFKYDIYYTQKRNLGEEKEIAYQNTALSYWLGSKTKL